MVLTTSSPKRRDFLVKQTGVWYNEHMNKGMTFRIYPNKEQIVLIQKTFGCSRFVYNQGLSMRMNEYKAGKSIGYKETNAMLWSLKKSDEYIWLQEVDSIALQQSLRDLDKAYKNFFAKKAGFPKKPKLLQ